MALALGARASCRLLPGRFAIALAPRPHNRLVLATGCFTSRRPERDAAARAGRMPALPGSFPTQKQGFAVRGSGETICLWAVPLGCYAAADTGLGRVCG